MSRQMRTWLLIALTAAILTVGVPAQEHANSSRVASIAEQIADSIFDLIELIWPEPTLNEPPGEEEPPILDYGPGAEPVG